MEKPALKSKNRLLKLLPKVASAVTFQSPPFSPSKKKIRSSSEICSTKSKTHLGKGSSGGVGPVTSLIPAEAPYKSTNSSSFAAHEPTSPKVSCMGQIKHKKKMGKYYQDSLPPMDYLDQVLNFNNKTKVLNSVQSFSEVKKKNPRLLKSVQSFKNIFGKPGGGKKSGGCHDLGVTAPSLSQIHRFSSGRSSLSSFDWTAAQIAPVESSDHDRNIYNDEGDEDKISYTAAPIQIIGGCKAVSLEPRKEINLWKRRTMAQPKPLQLNTL